MRRSTKTGDRSKAESKLAEFITIKDIKKKQKSITVDEACEFYIEQYSLPRRNDRTDRFCLRAPREAFGKWQAHTVTDEDVDAYIRRRMNGAYGKSKVKPATVRRELNAFQAALNFASSKNRIAGKPAFRFSKPQDGPRRDKWLTEKQVAIVKDNLGKADLDVRIFIKLALTYAVRVGAIKELRFEDQVNFLTGSIDFNVPGRRVNRKRRPIVPMTESIRGDLEEAFKGHRPGTRILPYNVDRKYQAFMKSLGLEWATAHVLKHTAITSMLINGTKPEDVATLTNTDLRTIMTVYRHYTMDELRNIAEGRGI